MHQILLGLLSLLLSLISGKHTKCQTITCSYMIGFDELNIIDNALKSAAYGIPSVWGRPPRCLSDFNKYKAEEFKSFTLFLWSMYI